jgi:hypothetical protein
MGQNMGFGFGLDSTSVCFKKKNRWLFIIDGVSADQGSANSLPPAKSARPSLSFKEMEFLHLTESIYYPGKPDWKPVGLTLFDLVKNKNPVVDWIKDIYDAQHGTYTTSTDSGFKKNARLESYDGCGNLLETWVFENAWPQNIEFGDLDMASGEILYIDLTLRYDRAYIDDGTN